MDVGCVVEFEHLADGLDSCPAIWKSRDTIQFLLEFALEHEVRSDSAVELIDLVGKALLL